MNEEILNELAIQKAEETKNLSEEEILAEICEEYGFSAPIDNFFEF